METIFTAKDSCACWGWATYSGCRWCPDASDGNIEDERGRDPNLRQLKPIRTKR